MKVVVLGAAGMLGHKMFQVLRERFAGTVGTILGPLSGRPLAGAELLRDPGIQKGPDATDSRALGSFLRPLRPDVVVNCVGIVKQRPDAKSPIPSIAVNSLLPHVLAQMCQEWGGRVIHFSTDCVFSGRRGEYTETDESDAEDLYGKSKFLGEVGGPGEDNALTLRTSIIGRELSHFQSLLEWFLAQPGPTVRGYTSAIYAGVTTNHLASLVADLIADHPRLNGLYQVASSPISKYDLLQLLRDAYGRNVDVIPDASLSCNRSMRGDRLQAAIGYCCPPWPTLVAEMAADPTPYQRWRT